MTWFGSKKLLSFLGVYLSHFILPTQISPLQSSTPNVHCWHLHPNTKIFEMYHWFEKQDSKLKPLLKEDLEYSEVGEDQRLGLLM